MYWGNKHTDFESLKGKTLTKCYYNRNDNEIFFETEDEIFKMYHDQDCCESVYVEDICGDLDDLIGSEIIVAEKRTNDDNPLSEYDESFLWTFYEIRTMKGSVTIRWYGSSNGYYSESVDFVKVK